MPTIKFSNNSVYGYFCPWDGKRKAIGRVENAIAFDTETRLIDKSIKYDIPQLVLATFSDGLGSSAILTPEQIGSWILAHASQHICGHNMVFDFWVVDRHLRARGEHAAVKAWWAMTDRGQLHDTMLLDQLINLAQTGPRKFQRRGLGELAKTELSIELDKSDPFRLRYGELLDAGTWEGAEEGFFSYAIKDAIITALLYRKLHLKATTILNRLRRHSPKLVREDATRKWGVLTESLQLRGAIALFAAGKRGIRVDLLAAKTYVKGLQEQLAGHILTMEEHASQVFVYTDELTPAGSICKKKSRQPVLPFMLVDRRIARTKKGAPRIRKDRLVAYLNHVAEKLGVESPVSTGKLGGLSTAAKDWKRCRAHPWIGAWLESTRLSKLLGYASPLVTMPEVCPTYNPLLVTGRVSARSPNVQQCPKTSDFRSLFVPRSGYKLLTTDYAAIELRTLAVICEQRYGRSVLAEVIRKGVDPHAYTAAILQGMTLEEFQALKKTDPERYKRQRQSSKAVGFGVPGGLGAPKLAAYALANYGVSMTEEEATNFRHKLMHEVYPELALYLADSTIDDLAWNTGMTREQVKQKIGHIRADRLGGYLRVLSKVLKGEPCKKDGTPYQPDLVERCWNTLESLSAGATRVPHYLRKRVAGHKPGPDLERVFFGSLAVTPTGRIRAMCSFTQAKNGPFQGLAADGAKLALWKILYSNRGAVVGFIHDEVLTELPAATAATDAKEIEKIMVDSMSEVLGTLPAAVESHLGDCWAK